MNTKITVLTGPESSGKTTLANQLSAHWRAPLVQEHARDYLQGKTSYQQHDLLEIARQQYELEQAQLAMKPDRIVCDTDLLVIMIWSELKYGDCDQWIYNTFESCIAQQSGKRIYYLCDHKIPWQADPLRENQHNRDELFDLYLEKLTKYQLDYRIVEGEPGERLQQVLAN